MYRLPGLTVCTPLPGDGRPLRTGGFRSCARRSRELASLGRWRSYPTVLIRRDGNDVVCIGICRRPVEDRLPLQGFGAAALKAGLRNAGLARAGDHRAGDPAGLFLLRHLSVPKAALSALPTILEQELARRTPFQLSDVWHAAIPAARGRVDRPFATGSFAGIAPRRR